MTQQALADLIHVTRQTVIAIEGDKYSPSLEVAFRIAHVFDSPSNRSSNTHRRAPAGSDPAIVRSEHVALSVEIPISPDPLQRTQPSQVQIEIVSRNPERNPGHSVLCNVASHTQHAGNAVIPASALLCPHIFRRG